MKKGYVSLCQHFFGTFQLQKLYQEALDHHGSLIIFDEHSIHYRSV